MTTKYMCTCCSTSKKVVMVVPNEEDGYLKCPHCGKVDMEVFKDNKGRYRRMELPIFIEDKETRVCNTCNKPYVIDIKD